VKTETKIFIATTITTLILAFTAAWIIRDPPPDTVQLKIANIPPELYPLQLEGWTFTIYYHGLPTTEYLYDKIEATKGDIRYTAHDFGTILEQIHNGEKID
jgi:hypothetical protein